MTADGDPFEQMFGSGTFKMPSFSKPDLLDRVKLKKWFRQGDEVLFKDVPYPVNDDGEKLPYGAVLDFKRVPIRY